MVMHVFDETSPGSGRVVHSATSAARVRNPCWGGLYGMNFDESMKACTKVVDAIRMYGDSEPEPGHAPVALAFYPDAPKDMTYFKWASEDGEGDEKGWRIRRVADAMEAIAPVTDMQAALAQIHEGLDWDGLGEATVVDVCRNPHIFSTLCPCTFHWSTRLIPLVNYL